MASRLTSEAVEEIINLRKTGHSLPEIRRITGRSNGTVYNLISKTNVLPEFASLLKSKQGGSKERARIAWESARSHASSIIPEIFSQQSILLVLAALYWGEGTKHELNIINGDPCLLRTTVIGLRALGVHDDEFRVTVRLFGKMPEVDAINYWSTAVDVPKHQFIGIERLPGNESKKLPRGMCRIRVAKGAKYFKLIMSMIDLIKSQNCPGSSMDRTSHS